MLQRASRSACSSWKITCRKYWVNYSKVVRPKLTFSGLNQDISLVLGTRHWSGVLTRHKGVLNAVLSLLVMMGRALGSPSGGLFGETLLHEE